MNFSLIAKDRWEFSYPFIIETESIFYRRMIAIATENNDPAHALLQRFVPISEKKNQTYPCWSFNAFGFTTIYLSKNKQLHHSHCYWTSDYQLEYQLTLFGWWTAANLEFNNFFFISTTTISRRYKWIDAGTSSIRSNV